MLVVRLLLGLVAIAVVMSWLGYAVSKDRRWLRFAGLSLKGGVALVAVLMIVFILERVLLML